MSERGSRVLCLFDRTALSLTLRRMAFAAPLHPHVVNGRTVYSWSQTLDDVTLVVADLPPVPASAFAVSIAATRLTLGLKGNPPYLDVRDETERAKTCEANGGETGRVEGAGAARPARALEKKTDAMRERIDAPPLPSCPSPSARPRRPRQAQRVGVDAG